MIVILKGTNFGLKITVLRVIASRLMVWDMNSCEQYNFNLTSQFCVLYFNMETNLLKIEFEDKTSILIDVLMDRVIPTDDVWFRKHVINRVLYLYTYNETWRKWLEGRRTNIDPRDQLIDWIKHWYAGYVLNQEAYRTRHNETN